MKSQPNVIELVTWADEGSERKLALDDTDDMWSELRYQHLATTMSKVGDEFKKIQQEAKDIKTSMKVTKTGEFLKKKASTSAHHCLIEDIGYVSYPQWCWVRELEVPKFWK